MPHSTHLDRFDRRDRARPPRTAGPNLDSTDVDGPDFDSADVDGPDFDRADLDSADFDRADFDRAAGDPDFPDDAAAELAAIEAEEAAAVERAAARAVGAALAEARTGFEAELERERAQTRAAVARYREAVLAAEPALPPDLVAGDTLEVLDRSLEAARRTVAQVRDRLAAEAGTGAAAGAGAEAGAEAGTGASGGASAGAGARGAQPGFPIGAPGRSPGLDALSASEKIALGLRERL